jgi:hypothetical protein
MHSIHDAPIRGQDDGKRKVTIEHQLSMLDDIAAGQLLRFFVRPVGLVELANLAKRYPSSGQRLRQFDKPIGIPGT